MLDEPATLAVGQCVRFLIDPAPPQDDTGLRPSLRGIAKGLFGPTGDDFNDPPPSAPRPSGLAAGAFAVPAEFDAPMPGHVIDDFEQP